MITAGDEYPIHQTADPIAISGTDRNFYDRYFFNGYSADGSIFFAAAMGVYPHLNIIDGAFSILQDGKQSSIYFSRSLNNERMDTQVGPFSVSVVEALKIIRISLGETDGISCDLTFSGRAFPIEEPRFTYRQGGSRTLLDMTRMTQNGHWRGQITLDGKTIEVGEGWSGTRDRSWGVRPIGASDGNPVIPFEIPQFYWLWTPVNFADRSFFFHVNDDAHGHPWNTRAVIVRDGTNESEHAHMATAKSDVRYISGTRRGAACTVSFTDRDNTSGKLELTPLSQFQMKGLGYRHPKWTHGAFISEEPSWEREDWVPADLPWADPHNLHIQAISKAVLTAPDGSIHEGIGSFEQLFAGAHAPSGLKSIMDGAP